MVAEEQQKAVRSSHREEEEQQRPRRPSHREAQQEALGAEVSTERPTERPNYWGLLSRLSAKVSVISLARARPRTPLFTLMFGQPRERAAIKLISRVVSLSPPISLRFLGSPPKEREITDIGKVTLA